MSYKIPKAKHLDINEAAYLHILSGKSDTHHRQKAVRTYGKTAFAGAVKRMRQVIKATSDSEPPAIDPGPAMSMTKFKWHYGIQVMAPKLGVMINTVS